MNPDQLADIIIQIDMKLQELKNELALLKARLEEHIKKFDAHKEPIQLPRWMLK